MDIDIRKFGNVHVVRIRGQFRLGESVDDLRASLDGIMNQGHVRFVASLGEVPMADSSGIGALVRYQTALKARGGALKLVSPSKLVTQTLKILGLLSVFEIFADEQQAIDSFGSSSTAAAT